MGKLDLQQIFKHDPEQAYALFEAACRMADDARAELAKAKERSSRERVAGVRDELHKALLGTDEQRTDASTRLAKGIAGTGHKRPQHRDGTTSSSPRQTDKTVLPWRDATAVRYSRIF